MCILEYPDRLEEKYYREDLASDFRLKVKHNIFDGDYLDNGTHEYIQLWADWGTTQYFINKRNGKMLQTCDKLSNGIHRDFSLLRPCFKTNDGYFVNEVSPGRAYEYTTLMKHLSDKDKEILNNSTKEDNPIFVFFKLKDF